MDTILHPDVWALLLHLHSELFYLIVEAFWCTSIFVTWGGQTKMFKEAHKVSINRNDVLSLQELITESKHISFEDWWIYAVDILLLGFHQLLWAILNKNE